MKEMIIKSKDMEIYKENKSATKMKRCMKTVVKKLRELKRSKRIDKIDRGKKSLKRRHTHDIVCNKDREACEDRS